MAVNVKIIVFWHVTPRSLVHCYQRFGGTCFYLQGKRENEGSSFLSEMLVTIYRTIYLRRQ
jgi:hypothetical protein